MAESYESGGGQPALAVASAHLAELLGAIDSVNSKAMFLIGLNVASNSLFVAVIASLGQPWWSAVALVTLAVATVGVGVWLLRPRDTYQFPRPAELLRTREHGTTDDELSWEVVEVLAPMPTKRIACSNGFLSGHRSLRCSQRYSFCVSSRRD